MINSGIVLKWNSIQNEYKNTAARTIMYESSECWVKKDTKNSWCRIKIYKDMKKLFHDVIRQESDKLRGSNNYFLFHWVQWEI